MKRKFPVQRNMYPVPGSLGGLLGEGRRLHTRNCSAQTEGLHLLLREIVSGFRIMQRWPARPALGDALPSAPVAAASPGLCSRVPHAGAPVPGA